MGTVGIFVAWFASHTGGLKKKISMATKKQEKKKWKLLHWYVVFVLSQDVGFLAWDGLVLSVV